jgi:hypothetical protein
MQADEDEEDMDERHDDPDSDMDLDYHHPPLEDSGRYFLLLMGGVYFCVTIPLVLTVCSPLCQFCVIGEVFKVQELRENLLELRPKIRYLITSV